MGMLLSLALQLSAAPAASPTMLLIRLLLVGSARASLQLLLLLLLAKARIAMLLLNSGKLVGIGRVHLLTWLLVATAIDLILTLSNNLVMNCTDGYIFQFIASADNGNYVMFFLVQYVPYDR